MSRIISGLGTMPLGLSWPDHETYNPIPPQSHPVAERGLTGMGVPITRTRGCLSVGVVPGTGAGTREKIRTRVQQSLQKATEY